MRWKITTFDGNNINDGTNYEAWLPAEGENLLIPPEAGISDVKRALTWSKHASTVLSSKNFMICVNMKGTFHSQFDTLKKYFDVAGMDLHTLVVEDLDGSGATYSIEAKFKKMGRYNNSYAEFILYTDDPVLKAVTETHVEWTVSGTGDKQALTVGGNMPAKPRLLIKPTSAGGNGFAYKQWVPVKNRTTSGLSNRPFDLVSDAWDTQTLVTASKMQADGDDLRVYEDGVEVPRWLDGINTATTKVWINLSLSPKQEMTLGANIAASGAITTITLALTTANYLAINKLPTAGIVVIGTEAFTYTGRTIQANKSYVLTGVTRAGRGTSMGAHTAADAVTWIEHDIFIYYGNAALTAPEQTDETKPMFELDHSTNTSWVYETFYDQAGKRTAAWEPKVLTKRNTLDSAHMSGVYGGDHGIYADPAAEMGMQILAYRSGAVWAAESADIRWQFADMCGVTTVTASGEKYRSGTYFPTARLQKSTLGTDYWGVWAAVWTDTTPAAAATWTALAAHSAVALGATYYFLRFEFTGAVGGADASSYYEISDVTLAMDSARIPAVAIAPTEINNYHIQAVITNNTSGEWIKISEGMELNKVLTIDCAAKTVTYEDGTNFIGGLSWSTVREGWLDVDPGACELQFDDTGTAAVTIDVYWKNRYL